MELENIKLEKKDHIALITIDHPPANAWNLATMLDFEKVVDDVEADKDVRVVILTGAGEKCFSAGFDVSDAANSHETSPKGRELWRRIDRFPKPVIAAINGFALGGGLELALCCQFRIMADAPKVMLGLTELNLGIIPGWGGTQRLPLVVGKARALDMMLFSKKIGAKEALDIGLVNQISTPENLMKDVFEFAGKLAQRPPIAVGCVLKAIAAGSYEGLDEGLRIEIEGSKTVGESKDCIEGFTAFLEKRAPVFKGE
ncbi:MAG: enoyl-CoA hydratase/isomerase family protein [Deltaproteobacteria bacterium]|nr:enoyl-CoA hydratase/isomerase family protein [Deltaproteobacteria bacterium]MBW2633963.1 enoyl-CoA hydratase/isomerase family protein [Deltaproteobacteria bacterium]MBW2677531.1 enoyl-CoA hydratase/isomerase family protein [Deltaproteobacteria bacterium]